MDATVKLWLVIVVVGTLNYVSRLSFIAVFARRGMPPWLARMLKYVPAAMLTALILPMVVDWKDAGTDFTTPNTTGIAGERDGNAAANRTAINSTITGLSIAPGATFFIRWVDSDATGADDGLAVDDLSVTATTSGGGVASLKVIAGTSHNSISDSPEYLPLLKGPQ